MKTEPCDPWQTLGVPVSNSNSSNSNHFEDSFIDHQSDFFKLDDSEEYLQKLYSRLKALQKGTSKKDLINSLAVAKEESIARLITAAKTSLSEEETELTGNPLIRHIAPHLQALTASELVHLLKADVLQAITTEQQEEPVENSATEKQTTQPE